jgi:hypothetical protein
MIRIFYEKYDAIYMRKYLVFLARRGTKEIVQKCNY